MHFKRYNLVIISSEWIAAASYYTPLTSEITRRILTTSTAQSVLTFFSTSNSIFFYSFFITKRTIIFIVIFLRGPDSSLAFDTYPLGLLLRTGETLEARCRLSNYYSRKNHYIAFPLLVKYSILFQSSLLFWTAMIYLVCIFFNRSIQIKIILRLKYRTSSATTWLIQLE